MRFQVVTITSLLAASAVALLPEVMAVKSREIDRSSINAIQYATTQADYSIWSHPSLIKDAGCIAAAIISKSIPGVLKCGAKALSEICPCASCFHGAQDFLKKHHACS